MLSKAVAMTLPLVLLILDVYVLKRIGNPDATGHGLFSGPGARWAWGEKLVYFALGGVFIVCAQMARRHVQITTIGRPFDQGPLNERIAQACYGTVFYVVKKVCPTG